MEEAHTMTLKDILDSLDPKDRVVINYPSGANYSGKCKKAKDFFKDDALHRVDFITNSFVPIPFRVNLVQQTNIHLL